MEEAHPAQMPLDTHVKLDEIAINKTPRLLGNEDQKLYQAIVGFLMYAVFATRPDISFAVATLCQYNSRPRTGHITAARRVLRYLKRTADLRLQFRSSAGGDPNNI